MTVYEKYPTLPLAQQVGSNLTTQKFHLLSTGTNNDIVIQAKSGRVLDASCETIYVKPFQRNNPCQIFQLEPVESATNTTYRILSKATGKALMPKGGDKNAFVEIVQAQKSNADQSQVWEITNLW